VLRAHGYDVVDRHDYRYQAVKQPTVFGDRVVDVLDEIDGDVVVFQRPLTRDTVELMSVIRDKGAAIVVEVDDDFSHLPLRHPARTELNPIDRPDHNWRWLELACQRADLVTVSTPRLAEVYGSHGRVVVLPNYVPESYLKVDPVRRRIHPWIGWSGSTITHVGDLQVTKGGIAQALEATDAVLHVIGTGQGVREGLGAEPKRATGWVDIEFYPGAMAALDVGIAPLRLSPFNDAKSHLKMLEWAALGVPCIGSPTDEYTRFAEAGGGSLAYTPNDWAQLATSLLRSADCREAKGEHARQVVADGYTIEQHAHRWWDAWKQAADNRAAGC